MALSTSLKKCLLFTLVALGIVVAPSIARAQQLGLTWVDNSGGQASFVVQRAVGTTGTYSQIAQVPLGVVSYTDTAVSLGTTYCYRVAAVNSAGMSAFSSSACGSPSGGVTLTVTKAGSGTGTVTGSPAGIDCGTTCSYTYPAGKAVTLTATPASGSTFGGWSGGGCSGTGSCTLVGNVSTSVTATFTLAGAVAVSSVAPSQGAPGAAVSVTITGSAFAAGATVSISGAGVTASNVTVSSATQITATLTIASGAASGARNVTVTNPGGAAATLTGGFSVSSSSASLSLAYNGLLRDRVGGANTALGPDGALDGTLTVTLNASGGRTVTALRLDSSAPGTWDTDVNSIYWVLGVATSLDGPLLNAPGSMAVNFAVASGGSFVLFASDYLAGEFLPGRTLTLVATFSDGSTAQASTTVAAATLSLAYNGLLRDRVGQGNTALAPDGALDGTFTVTLNATGGRTVTALRLDSSAPGTWDTDPNSFYWVLGVAASLDGPLLNAPGSMAVNFAVASGGSFVLFASDHPNKEFLPGRTLTLSATFSDGSTATAVMTVP